MQRSDFSPNSPGKTILVPQGYLAFVPAPLPPDIQWSNDLLNTMSQTDRSLAQLQEIGNNLSFPHFAVRPFIRKEAVLSSQIEGTQTTFEELLNFEAGKRQHFTTLEDPQVVQNYVHALEFGLKRLQTFPLSLRFIRETHQLLLQDIQGPWLTPGEFRQSQNWIGRPGATLNQARYVPPPVGEMQTCLSNLEDYLHTDSDLPPLLRIGLIHYQFEAIHPFLDGNGRIGRLLILFLMVSWGLLQQPLLYLSHYFENNRQEYYDRLMAVTLSGEWEPWLKFFFEGVDTQARDAIERISQLQERRLTYQDRFARDRSHAKLSQMVDYFISTPIASISQVQKTLDSGSYTTIQRAIEKLVSYRIIREVTGQRRNRIYQADEILKILMD